MQLGRLFLKYPMLLMVSTLPFAGAAAAIDRIDDRGVEVSLAEPANRIIALAPHLTELVYAAGAGRKLVGASRFSSFPEEAQRLPQVADAGYIDLERIVALRPDLVLAWKSGNQARDVARLERLGLPTFVTEPSRLDDIPRLLRVIGALADTRETAEREAERFHENISQLRKRYQRRRPVRVFYEIWHRPLLTVSGGHMISDVLAACGGQNIFAAAAMLTPMVSVEAVLAGRPEVILGGGSAKNEKDFVAQWHDSVAKELRDLPMFYIRPDIVQRATPRIVEGARKVCEDLEMVRERERNGRNRGAARHLN